MRNKLIFSGVILTGLLAFQIASAAPFVGPLVQCGTTTTTACQIGDLVTGVFRVINFLVGSATVLAMAYIVYGGARMILARGNESEYGKAKETMTKAIEGLIIVLMAYLIVTSVTSYLTGKSFADLGAFFPKNTPPTTTP